MGIRNKNSTNYIHPDEPNLVDLHRPMQYNDAGEPELRTHVHGITLEGDVIVDKVRVEVDSLHNTISSDHPVPVYFPSNPTVYINGIIADIWGTVGSPISNRLPFATWHIKQSIKATDVITYTAPEAWIVSENGVAAGFPSKYISNNNYLHNLVLNELNFATN